LFVFLKFRKCQPWWQSRPSLEMRLTEVTHINRPT
jgi:hypothetical protein